MMKKIDQIITIIKVLNWVVRNPKATIHAVENAANDSVFYKKEKVM